MIAIGGAAAIAGRDAVMIGAGGVALGAAIGAIGLGTIAAGDGIEKFQNLSWEAMGKAGTAIVALGAASALAGLASPLIIAGGAALGLAIASIGGGIAGAAWLLGNSLPTLADGLDKFAKLDGTGMEQAGKGMMFVAEGLAAMAGGKIVDSLGSLTAGLINFFTGNDPIKQLMRFGEISDPLTKSSNAMNVFSDRLRGFADAYSYLRESFNQPLSTEALANLTGLTDLIHREVERSSPGLIGSLFGSSTPAAPTPAATTAIQEAGAKVAITTPDQKHKELMEIMTKINLTLQGMSTIEDNQLRVMRTGFNQVSGTVY